MPGTKRRNVHRAIIQALYLDLMERYGRKQVRSYVLYGNGVRTIGELDVRVILQDPLQIHYYEAKSTDSRKQRKKAVDQLERYKGYLEATLDEIWQYAGFYCRPKQRSSRILLIEPMITKNLSGLETRVIAL